MHIRRDALLTLSRSAPRSPRCTARLVLLWLCLGMATLSGQETGAPRYRDPGRPVSERVRDLLRRMTLEEKFWQLFMIPGDLDDSTHDYSHGIFGLQIGATDSSAAAARAHAERINRIQRYFVERTRLGIPIIPFDEGLHGLVRPGATAFPQAIALAATWDTALVGRVAEAIARETRSRGVRQVLSPVLNLARDVRWGRVEETYGEDPHLASVMGEMFVDAMERQGVVATPKHFVANVGAGGRDSYPVTLSRGELQEVYFPPFEAALRRGARSIMTAYNSVDGIPATQNHWLLTDVVQHEWHFGGFVISDAAATGGATVLHLTEPSTARAAADAFAAGLDVVFQSAYDQYHPYWDAFRRGLIPPAVIDSAVARVLRAKFALGLFERPFVDPDSAAFWNGHETHRTLALSAAREGIVLLKNTGRLPLSPGIARLAVIGPDAVEARLGGYSGPGVRPVSILVGIRARIDSSRVRYTPGPGRITREFDVIPAEALAPGMRGEYYDNIELKGTPRLVRTDARVDFSWTLSPPGPGIRRDWYSVRWSGTLMVPPGRVRRIGLSGSDGFRLFLDDRLVVDDWEKRSAATHWAPIELEPGRIYRIRLEYFETLGNAHVRLVWDPDPPNTWQASIDSAVALARASDAAVIVAGIEEGEFRDRAYLGLPGHQDELIRAVAATGTPVVVVLVGGSAVTMSDWLDAVDGVLDVWYSGEEGGRAVAQVLFGDADPGGRLPITFPIAEGQLPLPYDHKPTGRGDDYLDLTGRPLFPFGYGLSYTTFTYSDLSIGPPVITPDRTAVVRCRVRNSGERAGDEVVQLYVHDELASVARPVLQLAGFQRVRLAPGETREVTFSLGPHELRLLDRDGHWLVEPGAFRVLVGASSTDLRLRGELMVR
jgi:beta-glucosidase